MSTKTETVIELLLGIIVTFFLLAALIPPTEVSVSNMQGALNGTITGEAIGTANGAGDINAGLNHPILNTSTFVIYNESNTPHTSWVNVTVTTTNLGSTVIINATGAANSTAGNALTMDYIRSDTQADEVASLPGFAYLLAAIMAFVGVIYLYVGRL